eukprot:3672412-Karenia_brevis.AAC.1
MFKKTGGIESNTNRHFGRVNVLFSGDFWQLHPTGDIAVMSNPHKHILNIMMAMSLGSPEYRLGIPTFEGFQKP